MSKKRERIEHRRQVAKARQRARAAAPREKSAAPPAPKSIAEKASYKDIWLAVGIVVLILAAFFAFYWFTVRKPPAAKTGKSTPQVTEVVTATPGAQQWSEPPAMSIDTTKSYEALIKTEKGDIRVQLYADKTPKTVNNFVFLARQHFYDGVTLHRVIEGFMAQTGDPTGTGRGGPGYSFEDEIVPELTFDSEGLVAMANRGGGTSTNGSQFFITYGPATHLNGQHTIFGKVIEGMDVARAISVRDPDTATTPGDKINTIEIIEK